MKLKKLVIGAFFLPLSGVFYGCATNPSNASTPTSTATEVNSKAEKKISMAIGQEVGQFTIAAQQKVEAPAGYDGTQYTVNTKTGKTFKCEILEASGFGKVITFGTSTGAGAMCTDFTKGSKDAGTTNKASCNALLKAAGKC
jgi:hypothetical protein